MITWSPHSGQCEAWHSLDADMVGMAERPAEVIVETVELLFAEVDAYMHRFHHEADGPPTIHIGWVQSTKRREQRKP